MSAFEAIRVFGYMLLIDLLIDELLITELCVHGFEEPSSFPTDRYIIASNMAQNTMKFSNPASDSFRNLVAYFERWKAE